MSVIREAAVLQQDNMERYDSDYDWEKDVEEFEKTKSGVKGLVDSGVTKLPGFFINPPESLSSNRGVHVQIPVIDFNGAEEGGSRRSQIIDEIRQASATWGFFQIINHGVPQDVMDGILESTRRVHEQPNEAKIGLYSSDGRQPVRFYTINGNFKKSDVASWRDSFACTFPDDTVDPEAIPFVCRSGITEYMKYMISLRDILSELLSEALGLSGDYLEQMECMKSEYLTCLYYPPCPEPEKTVGTVSHSDATILTVLVQDASGGLQILHEGNWVDLPPVPGALIANIGDFLQLVTNDKFKSVEHRVLARGSGTRVSAACFFFPGSKQLFEKTYGPIEELVSDSNPPVYKQVTYIDFVTSYQDRLGHGKALSEFQIVKKSC